VRVLDIDAERPTAPLQRPAMSAQPAKSNGEAGRALLSPSVRRLLANHQLAPGDIKGSGRNGRVTAQDVTRHVNEARPAPTPAPPAAAGSRVPHSAMRRRIAEHMVNSTSAAPHVTTLFEADLSAIVAHRAKHLEDFKRQGAHLTLTAYFACACVAALRAHPEVNATFHPDALELHADINIGVGTALGNEGLIVPVIHRAQDLSLLGIAQRLAALVAAARANKLTPSDVRGGTFTISNHGVGGSLLAAPIVINQPQVAILGVGKAERRVCVIESKGTEAIAIRTMAYLTLTLDHRAIDAFQGNAFLSQVVKALEQWPQS
jgi:2-oxoglutarate dehydrogenase E2 component (dihydrolipoamide succinyltransferase)